MGSQVLTDSGLPPHGRWVDCETVPVFSGESWRNSSQSWKWFGTAWGGDGSAEDLKLRMDLLSILQQQEKRFCHLLGSPSPAELHSIESKLTSLDLQGMMNSMQQIQQEALAAVQDAKVQLMTSANQLAACGVAKMAANTSGLLDVATGRQSAHSSCRSSEYDLLLEQRGKYDALNATWQSTQHAPGCSTSMSVSDPWESRVACFENVQQWMATSASDIQNHLTAWVGSLHAEHNQTSSCDSLQQAFEDSMCVWAQTQQMTCNTYDACYADSLASHLQLSSTANDTEHLSKADHVAAEDVLCRLNVFNAASPAEKEEALLLCDSQVVNVTHLDMVYPEVVEKEECPEPMQFPCISSWYEQTYTSESWYGTLLVE